MGKLKALTKLSQGAFGLAVRLEELSAARRTCATVGALLGKSGRMISSGVQLAPASHAVKPNPRGC